MPIELPPVQRGNPLDRWMWDVSAPLWPQSITPPNDSIGAVSSIESGSQGGAYERALGFPASIEEESEEEIVAEPSEGVRLVLVGYPIWRRTLEQFGQEADTDEDWVAGLFR